MDVGQKQTARTADEAVAEMERAGWTVTRKVTVWHTSEAAVATTEAEGKVRLTWYRRFTKQAQYPLYAVATLDDADRRVAWIRGRCPVPEEVTGLLAKHGIGVDGQIFLPDRVVDLD